MELQDLKNKIAPIAHIIDKLVIMDGGSQLGNCYYGYRYWVVIHENPDDMGSPFLPLAEREARRDKRRKEILQTLVPYGNAKHELGFFASIGDGLYAAPAYVEVDSSD